MLKYISFILKKAFRKAFHRELKLYKFIVRYFIHSKNVSDTSVSHFHLLAFWWHNEVSWEYSGEFGSLRN